MNGAEERIKLRRFVKNLLRDKTYAQNRIHTNRMRRIPRHLEPLLVISTEVEKNKIFSESPMILERTLALSISCLLEGHRRLDDNLDLFASQVEKVLGYGALFPIEMKLHLHQTELTVVEEGESSIGKNELIYLVTRHTKE